MVKSFWNQTLRANTVFNCNVNRHGLDHKITFASIPKALKVSNVRNIDVADVVNFLQVEHLGAQLHRTSVLSHAVG